ncbi:MAG: hypothetical protein K5927_09215 [Lachnospiraceae bacterium]|nr:hypothetical protein [Lachnospiraceae bacterium]
MKEFFRKKMVALKRKPQIIALIFLAVTFLIYSLNLRMVSDTTARINMKGMGLAGFATMLFSMLSFVCFLNTFPHRKKVNIPMLVIFFAMQGIILFCDFFYRNKINDAIMNEINTNGAASAQKMLVSNSFILSARSMLQTHQIFVIITIALVVTLPVYSKLLRMIKTSINVAGNDDIGTIDISGEDQ